MSAQINDGGPAFPGFDWIDQEGRKNPAGMTIRDYFAGQALIGVVFAPLGQGGRTTYSGTATDAYAYADAMIAARNLNKETK